MVCILLLRAIAGLVQSLPCGAPTRRHHASTLLSSSAADCIHLVAAARPSLLSSDLQLRSKVVLSLLLVFLKGSLVTCIMSLPRDEMAMLRVADYVAVIGIDWSDSNICHIRDPGSSAAIRELREHERVPMACVDRSPAIDHEGFPFPSNLAMFAFPHGSTVALQGSSVAARMSSFILSARNEFDKVRCL